MALASLVAACLYEMANGSETTIGSTSLCGDSYLMALALDRPSAPYPSSGMSLKFSAQAAPIISSLDPAKDNP